ncbi:MAG: DUF983 domain-containing protein [Alphaproteobacteria bacterium]
MDEAGATVIATTRPAPSLPAALLRGLRGRCPNCGHGRLLHRYLKVVDACPACGEAYGHFRADDAPPWLTVLVVGHLVAPIILMLERGEPLPLWLKAATYLPAVLLLTLALLPRMKGLILALMWHLRAEGSERLAP